MSSILIQPVPPYDDRATRGLVSPLREAFGMPATVSPTSVIDPAFAFDVNRNQYNSTSLISSFLELYAHFEGKVIAVSSVDLFVPVLTYVFGEAQLDGPIAVVSSHRLDETLYGLESNPRLLQERLIKEAVHELGHTFGLIHCRDYACVMHSSTTVEDIDVKSAQFCSMCASQVSVKVKSGM